MFARWPIIALALIALIALLAPPASARDRLGMFDHWAAFRDPGVPRCYAIGAGTPGRGRATATAYADIATWPRRNLRGTVHFRLSRHVAPTRSVTLSLGGEHYRLAAGGGDAWAADARMDAAIVAAMRSATSMSVFATDAGGHGFADTFPLAGAATAMDSAALGCAPQR